MNACGGYFLTSAVDRSEDLSAELLPARVLSLSDCICDFVPDTWAVEWVTVSPEERIAAAAKRGIREVELAEVVRWTTQRMDTESLGWPCVFYSSSDARAFAARFLSEVPDLRLVGIGLHSRYVDRFLRKTLPTKPSEGTPGVYTAIRRRVGLESDCAELGWEVLCYEYGTFHSWLCNGLETAIANGFGIKPNERGFISSAADADTAATYCGREDVGAEPGFWAPWLVVEYPLTPAPDSEN